MCHKCQESWSMGELFEIRDALQLLINCRYEPMDNEIRLGKINKMLDLEAERLGVGHKIK